MTDNTTYAYTSINLCETTANDIFLYVVRNKSGGIEFIGCGTIPEIVTMRAIRNNKFFNPSEVYEFCILYNQHFKCTSTFTRYELINLARLARQTRTPNGELYWKQIMKFFPDKTLAQVKNCYKHFIRNAAERSRTMPNE